jgi:hypothetical protein
VSTTFAQTDNPECIELRCSEVGYERVFQVYVRLGQPEYHVKYYLL